MEVPSRCEFKVSQDYTVRVSFRERERGKEKQRRRNNNVGRHVAMVFCLLALVYDLLLFCVL